MAENRPATVNRIAHKLLVLSGKGGVGKSTMAVHLAGALVRAGLAVGLMDVDMHGPSIPRLLGLREPLDVLDGQLVPASVAGLKVVSMDLLLKDADHAVIWRGPMKMRAIRQFLDDVAWGDLDVLVVDCPPGTGDEPLSVAQLMPDADGAVIVTTPQGVAVNAVRKSITFCRQLGLPIVGVVENMSGLVCPCCGTRIEVFGSGGGRAMAEEMGVAFLGAVPIDPAVMAIGEAGKGWMAGQEDSPAGRALAQIAGRVVSVVCAPPTA